ncbi:MAG TPA: flagellin, partial [Thermoguttaceae bacterium]|nr:flagellin [Thermoguttaceae bacterium]
AYNADASLVFTAVNQGEQNDDTIIRFKAADATITENVVTFDKRESAAEAYVTFTSPASDANMIVTAVENGDDFNNVDINFEVDATITDDAEASYDATTKTLTVSIKNAATDVNDIMAAIDAEGTFSAELDYAGDRGNDGTGAGFVALVGSEGTDGVWNVGNTGTTGGHEGGTLEFVLAEGADTAADVISLLNNDDLANKTFTAAAYSAGDDSGAINYRKDTNSAISSGGVTTEGKMTVHLATNASGIVSTTADDLVEYFDTLSASDTRGVSVSLLDGNDGSGRLAATTSDLAFSSAGVEMTDAAASGSVTAVNGVDAKFTITARNVGTDYDGVQLAYEGDGTAGSETAEYNSATKILTVHIDPGTTDANAVETAIESDLTDLFTVSQDPDGDGTGKVHLQDTATLSGGSVNTGTEDGASLMGNADLSDAGLTFRATNYGSDSFVSVKALSGTFNLTDSTGASSDRSVGTDVDVRINGIQAIGDGLRASINTSSLDLSFQLDSTVAAGSELDFTITGGGAQFQLGPDVVSNQQARLGIQSVNTAKLGGISGRLFELRSGGAKALDTDVKGAANVVEEVITQVTTLRGRLGAFQKTTLETNIASLSDTLENLTEAESSIRDADFAATSASLTRAQILVQAGVSVLSIANSNPQNILSLLR